MFLCIETQMTGSSLFDINNNSSVIGSMGADPAGVDTVPDPARVDTDPEPDGVDTDPDPGGVDTDPDPVGADPDP